MRILIPHQPFSVNSISFRDKRHQTPEYRQWIVHICNHLLKPKAQNTMKKFRDCFNPKKHRVSIDITFNYPEEILFTKKGSMSAKAHDVSNIEKPLIDVLFLPRYFDRCKNLNIDDKYISDMSSRKRVAESHLIEIELNILDNSDLLMDVSD